METEKAAGATMENKAVEPVTDQKAEPNASGGAPGKKKKKKKMPVKRIVGIVIAAVVVIGIVVGMVSLFHEKEPEKQLWTDVVRIGSIQTSVSGSGVTKPKDMKTITLTASGTVLEVFVAEGDWVNEGDPLYAIDSTDAQKAVNDAQSTVDDYLLQVDDANEALANLNVRAPYAGKLIDVVDYEVGDDISSGTKLATLVDDSRMKLSLYFSYAYKDAIYVGQPATISVPSTMSTFPGRVDEISYVQFVSPEGGMFFEVQLSLENPGTLTEGTAGSAELMDAAGNMMYPYEGATMTYNRKSDIIAKASGEILSNNLKNYQHVSSGSSLMNISDDTSAKRLASLQTQLREAQENLKTAQERLENFNAVAPMSGTILQCPLTAGTTVESGQVAVSIADTSTMSIDAQIDEMNVNYVKPGVICTVTQYGRDGEQTFTGVVDSVSLEGKYENGVSYFPAVITVDNPDGTLMSGMNVDYSMAASQSDDCMLVPVQAVKYTEQGTCLFIRANSKPDNALDSETLGLEVPDGFYAVPVTVGLSDTSSAEIISGVEVDTEVFVQYMTNQGDSYSYG